MDFFIYRTHVNYYKITYENAWEQAWYFMISCCPDEKMYTLSKKILNEKLLDWEPLDESFDRGLWKNTYVSILNQLLAIISQYNTLKELHTSKFSQDTIDNVYEWLNGIYEKVCEYKSGSDLRFINIMPNQEGKLSDLYYLYVDDCQSEELKEIAKDFSGRNSECNVYKDLIDKKIYLDLNKVSLSKMNDSMIAQKIDRTVSQLLSQTNLPDADLIYQEACTKLLSWIQEHLDEAKNYFPAFWKEEDQMRLLTPKAAVQMQKKAGELKEVLSLLDAENLEEVKEKLSQWKENEKRLKNIENQKEEQTTENNHVFFDGDADVFYYPGEFSLSSDKELKEVLYEIGIAGETFAFYQLKNYFLQQGYYIVEETMHNIKLHLENSKTFVELDYPDTTTYHQTGWDICIHITAEEKEEFYYIEVKTHTEQSIMRGMLCLSNEQMKLAARDQNNYIVSEVIYNFKQKQASEIQYYQNPIKHIADGKLFNASGKYELTLCS